MDNMFVLQENSFENLLKLLNISVGFNNSKEPWSNS